MSISWGLSNYSLSILLTPLIIGIQFLNIAFLLLLFKGATAAAVFGTVIVALTRRHASL